jgi:hypothetical protein
VFCAYGVSGSPLRADFSHNSVSPKPVSPRRPAGQGDRAERVDPQAKATYFLVVTFLKVIMATLDPFFVTNSSGLLTSVSSVLMHIWNTSPSME